MARTLYLVWGATGLSILVEFGLLLELQRRRVVVIDDAGGPLSPATHLVLVLALAGAAALVIRALRDRLSDPARLSRGIRPAPPAPARAVAARFMALSVVQWAIAEALALVGFTLAFLLQPATRLALTLYFTLALALWLWSRPDPAALREALRSAGGTGG